jgi:endo-1,4-beta-D-glucanase Y
MGKTWVMRISVGFSVMGILVLFAACSEAPGARDTGDDDDGGTSGTGTGGTFPTGGTGTGGGAMCAVGQLSCSGACTTVATDIRHCGMCNNACAGQQMCTNGQCTCTAGLAACTTGCVNTASDPLNCGTCGTACTGGLLCSQGMCSSTCAMGETQCGASCTNVQTDPFNCGFCTNACAGGQACVNGACGCPQGFSTCAGACVDTMTNASNCGTCGTLCGAGQACVAGVCTGGGTGGSGGAGPTGGSGGASGSGGAGPTGGSGGSAGGGMRPGGCPITPGLIADFEEGGTMPVIIAHEGRNGEWEKFADTSSTNQMMTIGPSGNAGMCDAYALRVTGSGYSSYAGFGFSLAGPKTAPMVYNATQRQFTGIRFKAKLGTGADMRSPVRFNISTPWTEAAANPGGQCTPRAATATKAAVDCYQHAGRFMPPGAGTNELTTQWKTFTYCFDRDLYPLSLPTNLTTEQRNNIATSMLKVQFQFNQGKDYSGAYPANAQYPAFAKTLPFDFWVDNLEFFTGACPNMVTSPSNGSPAKPFPQNTNVGTCARATNAGNYAAAIAEAYARWKVHFVRNNNQIVAPEQQNAITSEAMGYGMMIAAAMGDKAAFDQFHGYVKSQGGQGNGLMTWKNGGSGSASDGDIDIAYALLMANAQWPSGGYKTPSDQMAAAILSLDIVNNVVRGGSQFQSAPFNPSYFAPAAFRKFTGFGAAITENFRLVNANVSANTNGIPTDWANPSTGAPSGPGSAQVTSEITDGESGAMGYDAARVPWRLGLDVCTGGGASTALTAIVNAFAAKYDAGASIDLMKAGWYKARNGDVHPAAKDMQGSYIGPMGVGGMAVGNAAMRDRAFRAMLDVLESGDFNHTYFPSTVGMLTLLMMSGNFPTP